MYVRSVLHFNSFAAGVGGTDEVVFANLAMANHSCEPNALVDADEGSMRAIKEICCGDVVTISYLDDPMLLWPRQRRQAELRSRWEFQCACSRCSKDTDDMRRFRSCECGGELLVVSRQESFKCSQCGKEPAMDAADMQALLLQERQAIRELETANNADMEEEDVGQALIKCQRFAGKHPGHAVSLELAHDFAFPDVLPAQTTVIDGWHAVLGDVPCQMVVDAHCKVATAMQQRGNSEGALASWRKAAEILCLLDGREDPERLVKGWSKAALSGMQWRPRKNDDLDLDLDLAFGSSGKPPQAPPQRQPEQAPGRPDEASGCKTCGKPGGCSADGAASSEAPKTAVVEPTARSGAPQACNLDDDKESETTVSTFQTAGTAEPGLRSSLMQIAAASGLVGALVLVACKWRRR
eukprot:TRINITY_DN6473_c2_g1_i8.p1 TRINITY_DN6473_c2_g1~~TRINITY_DN6473_c2_g1_i8.p1  ORF type:complete len:410 (-),score=99.07 TRINITY_DN6473_c2_g1_i8:346-1575(-)